MYSTLLTLKEAFKGFTKNVWWNAVVLFLMVISFAGFSVFYIANENIKHISNELNEEMVVTVNLKEDVVDTTTIIEKLKTENNIVDVVYKSKEDVLKEAKREMGEESSVLSTFDGINIFPAQLIVSADSPENIKNIASNLEKEVFADKVYFGEKYIDDFLVFTEKMKNVGMIAAIVGIVVVIAVIMFVIKMNIEQRKEEIYIKSLIGASNYVIRMPFILETVILGMISFVMVYVGFNYVYDGFVQTLGADELLLSVGSFSLEFGVTLIGIILAVTLLAGILSTSRHVRKI